jgi:hypothetical protein
MLVVIFELSANVEAFAMAWQQESVIEEQPTVPVLRRTGI